MIECDKFHQRPKDFARTEEYAKFNISIDLLLDEFDHLDNRVIMITFLRTALNQANKAVDSQRFDIQKIVEEFYREQGYTDMAIKKILKHDTEWT